MHRQPPSLERFVSMDALRVKVTLRGRLLGPAVVFLCCAGSVCCFRSSPDSEFTFLLPAGRSECFFQTAVKNGSMEVEYQVNTSVVKHNHLKTGVFTATFTIPQSFYFTRFNMYSGLQSATCGRCLKVRDLLATGDH